MNGLKKLSEYVFYKQYAQRKDDGLLENWEESVERIYNMHRNFLISKGYKKEDIDYLLEEPMKLEKNKKILSSQRARQFASPKSTEGILKHNSKIYNCSYTIINRVDVFGEIMYLLLSGCGVGFGVHKRFIKDLPKVADKIEVVKNKHLIIEDSIEGWADAINVLATCIFGQGSIPNFDYTQIREKGTLINNKFKAPGYEPLKTCIDKIIEIAKENEGKQLSSFTLTRIICTIAKAVLSGGVRRSSCIALFEKDDDEMLKSKTGEWYINYPELSMVNISVHIPFGEELSEKDIEKILEFTKVCGEPGIIRNDSYFYGTNPCAEITLDPTFINENGEREFGIAFCNLVEIAGENINCEGEFYEACRNASKIATVQSLYTDFKYLNDVSKKIAKRDRAIGVSITGLLGNMEIFDKGHILEKGAKIVVETNKMIAKMLNINPSPRSTTIKPSGTASIILEHICNGIHYAHDKKYIRRVRTTSMSPEWNILKGTPLAKNENGEYIISFPIEIDENKNIKTKKDASALEHIRFISKIKHFWVNKGVLSDEHCPNNVSATVEVKEDEWRNVKTALYLNEHLYGGISFLPKIKSDVYYPNLPFTSLEKENDLKEFISMKNFLENNDIDFLKIMSERDFEDIGNFSAIACSGGSCELK